VGACNAILGLDDVRPLLADAGTDGGGGGGAGGATTGNSGVGGAVGIGGVSGTGGAGGVGGTSGNAGRTGTAGAGAADAGRSSCGLELSKNGNFELGTSSWDEAPLGTTLVFRGNDPALIADGVTPHSGQFVLRLGAPSDTFLTHYVEQYVDIPADASELTVSGFLQIRTLETAPDIIDEALVMFSDDIHPDQPLLASEPTWSNLTAAATWIPFTFKFAVAAIANKELRFKIVANLDESIATYFYFDDISVMVTSCSM
jgi:hypothetical protein